MARGPTPDINVTPLVDVVLVLLIIFMVIAPELEHGARVELPGIAHPDAKVKGGLEPITLTVTRDGQLFLEKEPVEEAALVDTLRRTHDAEPTRRMVLKADSQIGYGRARKLFTRAQGAGFPGVALLVGDRVTRADKDKKDAKKEAPTP